MRTNSIIDLEFRSRAALCAGHQAGEMNPTTLCRNAKRRSVTVFPKIDLIEPFGAAARLVLRAPVGEFLRIRARAIVPRLQHELGVCATFREGAPFLPLLKFSL